jgi:hypothetical protein
MSARIVKTTAPPPAVSPTHERDMAQVEVNRARALVWLLEQMTGGGRLDDLDDERYTHIEPEESPFGDLKCRDVKDWITRACLDQLAEALHAADAGMTKATTADRGAQAP